MFTLLNRGLEKLFGLRLVRGQRPKPPPLSVITKNNLIVEFMGPSGVGKTTLRDFYLKHHKFPFKGEMMTEKDLKKYDLKLDESNMGKVEIYELLFSAKLKELSEAQDSFIKTNRRLNLFYNSLKIDFFIRNYLSEKQVFLDQHVFKFFANDFIQLKETEQKQEFLRNRIIIYCKASPEKIMEYIEKRNRTDTTRPVHQNRDSKLLHLQLQEHLTQREKDVQMLKQNGAHILEINTENSLSKNSELIDDFMTDYFKSQKTL
ncbi:MAG: shikimate kinase [Aequorivita sp.]